MCCVLGTFKRTAGEVRHPPCSGLPQQPQTFQRGHHSRTGSADRHWQPTCLDQGEWIWAKGGEGVKYNGDQCIVVLCIFMNIVIMNIVIMSYLRFDVNVLFVLFTSKRKKYLRC